MRSLIVSIVIPFVNAYAALPDRFFAYVKPTPVANPLLIQWNTALANELGIEIGETDQQQLAQIFSGNQIPAGADPIAMAYSLVISICSSVMAAPFYWAMLLMHMANAATFN